MEKNCSAWDSPITSTSTRSRAPGLINCLDTREANCCSALPKDMRGWATPDRRASGLKNWRPSMTLKTDTSAKPETTSTPAASAARSNASAATLANENRRPFSSHPRDCAAGEYRRRRGPDSVCLRLSSPCVRAVSLGILASLHRLVLLHRNPVFSRIAGDEP